MRNDGERYIPQYKDKKEALVCMDLESCWVNLACFLGRGNYRLLERDGI